jgi:hypothetical protein
MSTTEGTTTPLETTTTPNTVFLGPIFDMRDERYR